MKIFPEKGRFNPYIILFALVVVVSAPSLKNSFLSYDDAHYIVNNPTLDISFREIPSLFTKPLGEFPGSQHQSSLLYYRPLLQVLYIFDYALWGKNPVGFHMTNILFHLLSAIFVYRIGLRLFENNKRLSLFAASLFAVYPVNSEVLHRVAMNENMYGFFMITSIFYFIGKEKYLSWLTFSLALMSKESAVMLPFALFILSIDKEKPWKGLVSLIPYAVIMIIYLVVRQVVMGSFPETEELQKLFRGTLTMAAAFIDYVRLLVMPYPLHVFYPARFYTSITQPKVLAAISMLMLLSLLAFRLRSDKKMLFLLLSPFVLLVPAIVKVNTFPIRTDLGYIAERLLYVPAMVFSLFISSFVFKTGNEGSGKSYRSAAFTAVIIAFAVITFLSCGRWENDETFYAALAGDAPHAAVVHYYRGTVLFNLGKFNEAQDEFKASVNSNASLSGNVEDLSNLSGSRIGRNRSKAFDLNRLWEYQPAFADTHFALGCVLLAQGNIDAAIRKFRVALILNPALPDVHLYLAEAYMKRKEFDNASKEFHFILRRSGTR
jgi:hypothetical protein